MYIFFFVSKNLQYRSGNFDYVLQSPDTGRFIMMIFTVKMLSTLYNFFFQIESDFISGFK